MPKLHTGLLLLFIMSIGFSCQIRHYKSDLFPQSLPDSDTVHIFPLKAIEETGVPIPHDILFEIVDYDLFANAGLEAPDSINSTVTGCWILPLDEDHSLYLIEVLEHWFVFKHLLVYSHHAKEFTKLIPAAQFYGGEGGQVWIESHLFGKEKGDDLMMLVRRSDHEVIVSGGDFEEHLSDEVDLFYWGGDSFRNHSMVDSASLISAYPIKW